MYKRKINQQKSLVSYNEVFNVNINSTEVPTPPKLGTSNIIEYRDL